VLLALSSASETKSSDTSRSSRELADVVRFEPVAAALLLLGSDHRPTYARTASSFVIETTA
jgi:hypothetical protein